MAAVAYQRETERLYTVQEYLELERNSELKHEYVEGRILPVFRDHEWRAMAGASPAHVQISSNLLGQLYAQLRGSQCSPLGSDQRVSIPQTDTYIYPDL